MAHGRETSLPVLTTGDAEGMHVAVALCLCRRLMPLLRLPGICRGCCLHIIETAGKKIPASLYGVSMTHQIEYMQELSLHGMRHVQDLHIELLMDKTLGSSKLQLVLPPCAQWRVPDLRLPWLWCPDSILADGQLAYPSADAAKWTVGPCEGECMCFKSVYVRLHDVHRPSRSH